MGKFQKLNSIDLATVCWHVAYCIEIVKYLKECVFINTNDRRI